MKKSNTIPQIPPPPKEMYHHLVRQKFTEISEENIFSFFRVKRVNRTRNQQEPAGKLANTFEGS
jgi:hypothetical protein